MSDLLHSSSQAQQASDDPPYGAKKPPACTPQRTRAPSNRAHAKRASQLLAAQLSAETAALQEGLANVKEDPCGPCDSYPVPMFTMPAVQDEQTSQR